MHLNSQCYFLLKKSFKEYLSIAPIYQFNLLYKLISWGISMYVHYLLLYKLIFSLTATTRSRIIICCIVVNVYEQEKIDFLLKRAIKHCNKQYLNIFICCNNMYLLLHLFLFPTLLTLNFFPKQQLDFIKHVAKAISVQQYRDIVKKNNVAFHIPKKDKCDVCYTYERMNPYGS